MSKKVEKVESCISPSWGYGYVLSSDTPDRINGRLFGLVEAIGLPDKQEKSLKDLIRDEVWRCFQDAVIITEERHNELRDLYYKQGGGRMPVPAI